MDSYGGGHRKEVEKPKKVSERRSLLKLRITSVVLSLKNQRSAFREIYGQHTEIDGVLEASVEALEEAVTLLS